jgi:predicted Zn finger-like uncharacterized protein
MPKEVLCPICGAAYNLADEQIGKKVRCKKCEHAFTAGDKPKRRDDDDDDEPRRSKSKAKKGRDRDRDEEEEEAKPRKTKSIEEQAKPKGQREPGLPVSSFVIMGIVVAVLVVCCGGGGLFWFLANSKPNVQPPPPRPNPNPPKKRGERPAKRPPVVWLNDITGARRGAGCAAQFADLLNPNGLSRVT